MTSLERVPRAAQLFDPKRSSDCEDIVAADQLPIADSKSPGPQWRACDTMNELLLFFHDSDDDAVTRTTITTTMFATAEAGVWQRRRLLLPLATTTTMTTAATLSRSFGYDNSSPSQQ